MICSNCKTLNNDSSKFCIKCGSPLVNRQTITNQPSSQNQTYAYQNQSQLNNNHNYVQMTQTTIMNSPKQSINNFQSQNINSFVFSFKNCLLLILSFILKPFTTFKEKNNAFNAIKNSMLLTLIIAGVSSIINLFMNMISSIFVKTLDIKTFEYKTTIVWENLKEIKYFQLIFKEFITIVIIILAISIIYYLASLIIKKNANFSKFLGISALSIVPLLVCNILLKPLTVLIFPKISIAISIIGLVYTIIILYENINSVILLDGNMKYYFNLICLSIIAIAGYYLLINTTISSVHDSVNDILNNFEF